MTIANTFRVRKVAMKRDDDGEQDGKVKKKNDDKDKTKKTISRT